MLPFELELIALITPLLPLLVHSSIALLLAYITYKIAEIKDRQQAILTHVHEIKAVVTATNGNGSTPVVPGNGESTATH